MDGPTRSSIIWGEMYHPRVSPARTSESPTGSSLTYSSLEHDQPGHLACQCLAGRYSIGTEIALLAEPNK